METPLLKQDPPSSHGHEMAVARLPSQQAESPVAVATRSGRPGWVRGVPFGAFALGLASLLSGGLAVNSFTGSPPMPWLPLFHDHALRVGGACTLAFVLASFGLLKLRHQFLAPRTLYEREVRPRHGLILLLSPPDIPLDGIPEGAFSVRGVPLTGDVETDDRALVAAGVRWRWQQLLRGLAPHRSKVSHLYLIGSKGDPGSFDALDDAKSLILHYARDADVHKHLEAVDFEDLNALTIAIRTGVRAHMKAGLALSDIMIDVTGGPKTASIAGAIFTLNSNVTFQYVQTNKPFKPREYDLELSVPNLV
ncbi:MAG: hypothetical protein JWM27_1195 [Gemmatimonadetes bacterium]|nr:hypothetical protein [Gemmatimonadota bacterium]